MSKRPPAPLNERIVDAETRGNYWLAEGNEAKGRGGVKGSEEYYRKGQFWLDRYNLLTGRSGRPAPKQ